jgi:hypothetical protein
MMNRGSQLRRPIESGSYVTNLALPLTNRMVKFFAAWSMANLFFGGKCKVFSTEKNNGIDYANLRNETEIFKDI